MLYTTVMIDIKRDPLEVLPRQEAPAEQVGELSMEQGRTNEIVGEASSAARLEPPQSVAPVVKVQQDPNSPQVKIYKDVEKMLSRGLKDVYVALPSERKLLFKTQGEETARAITDRIMKHDIGVKDVWKLTSDWLGNLPGINKYFLEQEIKIKTDQVMDLAEAEQGIEEKAA